MKRIIKSVPAKVNTLAILLPMKRIMSEIIILFIDVVIEQIVMPDND